MHILRGVYRNPVFEGVLLLLIGVQIVSGGKLLLKKRRAMDTIWDKIQMLSGAYLALFFIIHLSALWAGRSFLHLDTNLYFGIAGLNTFPFSLFFIPYYALAIIAFFTHLAAIHSKKMKQKVLGLSVSTQSSFILIIGLTVAMAIIYGLTNRFQGVIIPKEYNILIGK